ncbi:MAG: hypothetical protein IJ460_04555 [Clostridia bacterium]|nr:hypothetical protein [Clostridia bacterium]
MICEKNDNCKERFREIESRLDEGDKLLIKHSTDIAVLHTNIEMLIKSMNCLTKALWGICGTTITTLFGFLIWYVQNIGE